MTEFDNNFRNDRIINIAGVDEAGRGPLAGPVVAAAVIFPADVSIDGINDSKLLSEAERNELFPAIISRCSSYSVAAVSHGCIDRINILNATMLAMKTTVERLSIVPDLVLLDGNRSFTVSDNVIPIVKGDSKSFAIAAASVIAKVVRDRIMMRLAYKFPNYGWESNKGYPTKSHIEAVRKFGPSSLHRRTFLRKILQPELNVLEL